MLEYSTIYGYTLLSYMSSGPTSGGSTFFLKLYNIVCVYDVAHIFQMLLDGIKIKCILKLINIYIYVLFYIAYSIAILRVTYTFYFQEDK